MHREVRSIQKPCLPDTVVIGQVRLSWIEYQSFIFLSRLESQRDDVVSFSVTGHVEPVALCFAVSLS